MTSTMGNVFIGGRWCAAATSERIEIISPITEEPIGTVPVAAAADIDAAVAAARRAFDEGPWPRLSVAERAEYLARIAVEVERRVPEMQKLFTQEIGAPLAASQLFHSKAVATWRDISGMADSLVFEEDRDWDGQRVRVRKEPVGVVAAIIPWNGPVGTASLKIAPALLAGCPVILKGAPEGPSSLLLLADALAAAGLPEGVVSVLIAEREVSEYLVRHPGVDKVTFTGSTEAGKRIMSLCGNQIKRVALELGGKSAAILAEDIDLAAVLPSLLTGGIAHSGQVCTALTRILVPRSRHDEVVEAMGVAMDALILGDPFDPETDLGPLAMERQRDRVEHYVGKGIEEGARLVRGGRRPETLTRGWYYEPTLFAGVTRDMTIAREEIFGPVLVVMPYDGIDDAIGIANDSDYGLYGAVYSADRGTAEYVADRVRSGQFAINSAMRCVVQPFGGFKQSGLGREGGPEGVYGFTEAKVIIG